VLWCYLQWKAQTIDPQFGTSVRVGEGRGDGGGCVTCPEHQTAEDMRSEMSHNERNSRQFELVTSNGLFRAMINGKAEYSQTQGNP
jgi:hypothetical protein